MVRRGATSFQTSYWAWIAWAVDVPDIKLLLNRSIAVTLQRITNSVRYFYPYLRDSLLSPEWGVDKIAKIWIGEGGRG